MSCCAKSYFERPVKAVFAGTNSRLANFMVDSDGSKLSRAFPEIQHHVSKKRSRDQSPIFQTTMMGCSLPPNPRTTGNDHIRVVYYGRPLFAVMANANVLDGDRMLLVKKQCRDMATEPQHHNQSSASPHTNGTNNDGSNIRIVAKWLLCQDVRIL